ncbi:MAG: ECF transporter S component [Chloroflexales bacterium]
MSVIAGAQLTRPNTRQIVIAGVLGAISIVLSVTRLGYLPVPNLSGDATILHVPVIIGAVLEGPVVGSLVGLIFGIFSLIQGGPLFANPLISVVPRILIGITSWLAYRSLQKVNVDVAAAVAGIVGTLTNTILVVGGLVGFGLIPAAAVVTILPQAGVELVLAAILTPLVVRGVRLVRSGRTTASERTPRDKSSF